MTGELLLTHMEAEGKEESLQAKRQLLLLFAFVLNFVPRRQEGKRLDL